MRHTTRRSFHEGLAAGVVIAAFVFAGFTSAPASAGQYACPDMTGLDGLPDGHVDASDLSAFAAAKGSQSSTGDFNGDGPVDDIDQAMFEEVFGQSDFSCNKYWAQQHARTPSCVDMTHDGNVDASDLSAFAAAKASNGLAGDFSGDNQVTGVDQAILAHYLGSTGVVCGLVASINPELPPPPPVEQVPPEPPVPTEQEVSIDQYPVDPITEQQSVTPAPDRAVPSATIPVSVVAPAPVPAVTAPVIVTPKAPVIPTMSSGAAASTFADSTSVTKPQFSRPPVEASAPDIIGPVVNTTDATAPTPIVTVVAPAELTPQVVEAPDAAPEETDADHAPLSSLLLVVASALGVALRFVLGI